MNTEKLMQVTLKPGIHIFVKVNSFDDYKDRKSKITKGKEAFVDVLDECTLRRDDVVAIEYFEKEIEK